MTEGSAAHVISARSTGLEELSCIALIFSNFSTTAFSRRVRIQLRYVRAKHVVVVAPLLASEMAFFAKVKDAPFLSVEFIVNKGKNLPAVWLP